MKSAGVAELKAHLSRYLASVKEGEEVTVTERGRPIARLIPLALEATQEARMQRLARAGIVRLPTQPLPKSLFEPPTIEDPEGRLLKALLDERDEGW